MLRSFVQWCMAMRIHLASLTVAVLNHLPQNFIGQKKSITRISCGCGLAESRFRGYLVAGATGATGTTCLAVSVWSCWELDRAKCNCIWISPGGGLLDASPASSRRVITRLQMATLNLDHHGPPWTTWFMDVHGNYPCNILLHHVNSFAMKTIHVNSSINTQYSNILNQLRS